MATANLPCVQGSDSEFCPYSEDVVDQFSANSDSSDLTYNISLQLSIELQACLREFVAAGPADLLENGPYRASSLAVVGSERQK